MPKRSIAYFTLIIHLFFSISVFAQKRQVNDNKSLLWRISSKDMKKPSYLFGTIHLICPEDYVWTEKMKQSFISADEVCFELDLDDPNMMVQVATGMINTNGKTLKEYFSEADYQKLSQYVSDSLKMSISLFQQMKPVALQTLFTTQNTSCQNPVSYESNLVEEAKAQKKEIVGLESVSEQLDLFDNLPVDSVIKEIMNTVNGLQTDNTDFAKLINAYKKQDLPALYKLIKESSEMDKDLDGFLDVRNEKWIPRMIEKMDNKSMFFAVGAGHLYGDNGLIDLMRKAGYTVTPIK